MQRSNCTCNAYEKYPIICQVFIQFLTSLLTSKWEDHLTKFSQVFHRNHVSPLKTRQFSSCGAAWLGDLGTSRAASSQGDVRSQLLYSWEWMTHDVNWLVVYLPLKNMSVNVRSYKLRRMGHSSRGHRSFWVLFQLLSLQPWHFYVVLLQCCLWPHPCPQHHELAHPAGQTLQRKLHRWAMAAGDFGGWNLALIICI